MTEEKRILFKKAILKGPEEYGFETNLWTLSRLAAVMKKATGVKFKHNHTWEIVRSLGFTCQKPQVKAKERDEQAIKEWKEKQLPVLKKMGIKTWALKGKTPVIVSSSSWKSLTMAGLLIFTPKGNNPRMIFRLQAGSMDKYDFCDFLEDIKTELKGKKLLLIWDGLPAHRAKKVADYIKSQKRWLRVERYPAYAPELSPLVAYEN
ncbi:winged helix-turn-helix domain-containing protein [Patescibacteria group bacterium]|nr:winged helix-turn-helix domain-containing protein [Patescibacteria group bacterium]MBU4000264.1 winged helix-turn-helix domain-containing protein [Patescibacteria group bacterium]MBU4368272.1 winged helix-turn-helix domain-containing protein [Patescibacteria group bacterium]